MVSRSLRAMLSLDAKGWFPASLPEGRMRFTKTGDLFASPPVKKHAAGRDSGFLLAEMLFSQSFFMWTALERSGCGQARFFSGASYARMGAHIKKQADAFRGIEKLDAPEQA